MDNILRNNLRVFVLIFMFKLEALFFNERAFFMILIGIDPDVDKNGFAMKTEKGFELANLTFFELFERLKSLQGKKVRVYVECGFLNKSNWHKINNGKASVNSMIGNRTGRNHETARKIIEMCEYLKLEFIQVKPTSKKVDNKTFQTLTGITKRTNQEQRDACMLIVGR